MAAAAPAPTDVTQPQRAKTARPARGERTASRDRHTRAVIRPAPHAVAPAEAPAGGAPRAVVSAGARHELPGLALVGLAVVVVAAVSLVWRRRRGGASVMEEPLLPTPLDMAVEAELQEIVAEERMRATAGERERAPLAG